jgi:hypothetical protein
MGTIASRPAPPSAILNALALSALAAVAFAAFVLIGLGGWAYYTAPKAVRGYSTAHRLLRPSGAAGHLFGIGGFVLMLVPIAYSIRKKVRRFREMGSMKTWLEVHVFCGLFGPLLVTFHTSFKFNGIVSVAYWSMVAVVLSGFVGRYLFNRMPKSLRGVELTRKELDARADQLGVELAAAVLPAALMARVQAFERGAVPPAGQRLSLAGLFFGELAMRQDLALLRANMKEAGMATDLLHSVLHVIAERASLLRRAAYLQKVKRLFELWHVFHMPLVYVMFAIIVLHVAFTLYMGYVPFVH